MAHINVGRFNGILGRMLSMGGMEDPAGELSPEISAVLVMENDRPEWKYLANEKLCAGVGVEIASGAFLTASRLRNPVGSGVLAVVEFIRISMTLAGRYSMRFGLITTDRATAQSAITVDARFAIANVAPALVLSSSAAAFASSVTFDSSDVLASAPVVYEQKIILFPGSALEIGSTAINTGTTVAFSWRERAFQPFEA